MDQHPILSELCVDRVRSRLHYQEGNHLPTKDVLAHVGNEPSLLLLNNRMGGSGNLGTDYCKPLYDSTQRAIVVAFQGYTPTVQLAFRDSKQQATHKLSDVSHPIAAITAFSREYGAPSSAARLFLHLGLTNSPQLEAEEGWVEKVMSAVKIASLHSSVPWSELSKVVADAEALAALSSTITRLLPSAKQRLEKLMPTREAKRQRIGETSSSVASTATSMVVAPPTTVILAPDGGSLSQHQVDDLVAVGVCNCITELALMPAESSAAFYNDLILAGPDGRKKLANKITTKFADLSWKINAGTQEKLLAYRQEIEFKQRVAQVEAEEEDRKQREERANKNAAHIEDLERQSREEALPWLERFSKPIDSSEWDATLLHKWAQMRKGLPLLVDDIESLARKCQLPSFVRYLAVHPQYNRDPQRNPDADGFLGEFTHPNGDHLHIHFASTTRCLVHLGVPPLSNEEIKALPHLQASPSYGLPWNVDPTPAYPTNIAGGGPFVKFLLACDASSKCAISYNTLVTASERLKLATATILFETLRARFMGFCTNNALDFEEADLSAYKLRSFDILKHTSCKDGREYVTGFSEAPLTYVPAVLATGGVHVSVRLGVHRNGHVGVATICI